MSGREGGKMKSGETDQSSLSSDDEETRVQRLMRMEKVQNQLNFSNPGPANRITFGASITRGVADWPSSAPTSVSVDGRKTAHLLLLPHDEHGLINGQDLCDCLNDSCVGCFFPCEQCGSTKCGPRCRQNRNCAYESASVEGSDVVRKNPLLPPTIDRIRKGRPFDR